MAHRPIEDFHVGSGISIPHWLFTNAARWKTGADITISNGFRFGNPIVPENGKPAPITRANL